MCSRAKELALLNFDSVLLNMSSKPSPLKSAKRTSLTWRGSADQVVEAGVGEHPRRVRARADPGVDASRPRSAGQAVVVVHAAEGCTGES
jgi:hypothetical protein